MTSLIYVDKLEFENPTIMEENQCKQVEQFLPMAKGSDYFVSLDDKPKQIYNVKIHNIQGHDPNQIKGMILIG